MTAPAKTCAFQKTPILMALLLSILALHLTITSYGQEQVSPAPKFKLLVGSRLWFDGDSTLHKFQVEASKFEVSLSLPSPTSPINLSQFLAAIGANNSGQSMGLVKVHLSIDSLKSGKDALDKNMQTAMNSSAFPEISFQGSRIEAVKPQNESAPLVQKAAVTGELSVSGASKTISLEVVIKAQDEELLVEGEFPLLMSQFGIKPPSMFLGTLKTKDKVQVHFKLKFKLNN